MVYGGGEKENVREGVGVPELSLSCKIVGVVNAPMLEAVVPEGHAVLFVATCP